MSGIAEILLTMGYAVSGSDLRRRAGDGSAGWGWGRRIFEGHAARMRRRVMWW
jgi:UDP-N-acetylmuramate--alanine ligase